MSHMADWFKAVGPFFTGIVALLIALFRDDYQRWKTKPKLHAAASNHSPHCVRNTHFPVGTSSVERPHYSLRIAIENCGNTEARDVEVFVKDLQRQKGRGDFEPVTDFLGTYLIWSGLQEHVLSVLNPEMPKYCYLARIFSKEHLPTSFYSDIGPPVEDYLGDRTVLDFPPPVGSGRRQCFAPGHYRLTAIIGAANAKPIKKVLKIDVTGRWTERVSEVLDFRTLSS